MSPYKGASLSEGSPSEWEAGPVDGLAVHYVVVWQLDSGPARLPVLIGAESKHWVKVKNRQHPAMQRASEIE